MEEFEHFQFLAYRWDIAHAKTIADDLPVERFDPQPFFGWLDAVRIDTDHVPHADLDQPLILARVRELGGAAMLIDGWHRLARARREGTTDLPCVVLDQDQEREVRIFGGTKHAGDGPSGESFAEQEMAAALLGEIADHFTEGGQDQETYAGLTVTEARHERDAVRISGYDRQSRTAFTATATVRVTATPPTSPDGTA